MDRIIKLQGSLTDSGIDGALLLYHRDVYYYAGTARPASLVITPDDAVLFARRATDWITPESSVREIREGGISSMLAWLKKKGTGRGKIGLEMDLVPASIYSRLRDELPQAEFADVSPIVLAQRRIKDEHEIESTEGACRIVEEAHRHLPVILKEGMSELELSAELERIARMNGHETFAILRRRLDTEMSYMHVLAGESTKIMGGYGQVVTGTGLSAAFPYGSSRRKIRAGDVVVFDIAGMNEGYHSDLARTYCVGKAAPEVLEAHSALAAIQSAIIEVLKPGSPSKYIYETAIEKARETGWADYFQGQGNQQGTFVGHGLGLEVDELPLLSPEDETVLDKNMTLTTELFIVHPGFGEVKLEDTILVTENNPRFLTRLEREVKEI